MSHEVFTTDHIPTEYLHHTFYTNGAVGDIIVPIHDNIALVNRPEVEPLLLMAGLGETRQVAKHTLARLAQLGMPAIAPEIDYARAPKNLDDSKVQLIERVTREVPVSIARQLYDIHSYKHGIEAVSNSLGGALQGTALGEAPELYGNQAFINPLGLTLHGSATKESNLAFLAQYGKATALSTNPFQRGILMASRGIMSEFFRDAVAGLVPSEMEVANHVSTVLPLAHHADDHRVTVLSSGEDKMFSIEDMQHNFASLAGLPVVIRKINESQSHIDPEMLTPTGLKLVSVEGLPHANLAMKAGKRLMNLALESLDRV